MDRDANASTAAVFDGQELLARCMGNCDFAQRILAKFQARLADDLAKLEEAAMAGNTGQVATVAHRLKGAAANVAAHGLRDRAAAIEEAARSQSLSNMSLHFDELRNDCSRFAESVSLLSEKMGGATSMESNSCESW